MGRFNISLPNNVRGEVRWGTVRRIDKGISVLLDLLPWRKLSREEKTGYVITVEPATERQREYRLFKSKAGQWTQDAEGTIPLKHETLLALQTAIEAHDQEAALR